MFRMTTLVLLVGRTSVGWAQDNVLILPANILSAVASVPEKAADINLDKTIESGARLDLSARGNPASVSVADRATMDVRRLAADAGGRAVPECSTATGHRARGLPTGCGESVSAASCC